MKIKSHTLPSDLVKSIKNPDPLEGEDIAIEDEEGNIIGIIIQPKAYEFFIKKVQEKEDAIDSGLSEKYDERSKSLSDLMEDEKNE